MAMITTTVRSTPILAAALALACSYVGVLSSAGCDDDDGLRLISNNRASYAVSQVPSWAIAANSNISSQVSVLASQHLAPSEMVVQSMEKTVCSTGNTLYRIATYNSVTQDTRKFDITDKGVLIDYGSLLATENSKLESKYGKATITLFNEAKAHPTLSHDVAITCKIAPLPQPRLLSNPAYIAGVKQIIQACTNSLIADLKADGCTVTWQGDYTPVIHAGIGGDLVINKYSKHVLVESIAERVTPNRIHGALQSTNDLFIPAVYYNYGFTGTSEKVGVTGEEGNGLNCVVHLSHPYYSFGMIVTSSPPTTCNVDADCVACNGICISNVCVVDHGTKVVGMIGHEVTGTRQNRRGAPDINLYMTNSRWTHAQELNWLYGNDVIIESESWLGGTDVWNQDWFSILGMTITEAAMNGGVTSPASCHASSTICVAAYSTMTQFSDFTSTANFTSCSKVTSGCDREVPDVTLHGENVITTIRAFGPLGIAHGTSFSTPAAAGLVALMYDRWPAVFKYWPGEVRAAMMASADRDVHQMPHTPQCPTTGKTYSDYRCPDERDGAGVPNAQRIENMVSNGRVSGWWIYAASSFDPDGKKELGQVYLQAGKRLRAVISWDSCPGPTGTANGAHADLDLHIVDPNNNVVFYGASWDGTYEIAEIVASQAGTYKIVLKKNTWLECPILFNEVNLGLAYDVK